MTVEIRTADSRPVTRAEGRTTWHSFSFGAHYDPRNVGLGRLVAHNDELLPPGTGYAEHPHADLEIVTWVLSGALRHASTVGTGTVTPGRVQHLSAGSGVRHSEVSDAPGPTRFLQAWVRPDEPGTPPRHVVRDVERGPGWTCLAADAHAGAPEGAVTIGARGTSLHVADLAAGGELALPEAALLHVFVATGQLTLGERRLAGGDAARLLEEGGRAVRAEADAHVVVWAQSSPHLDTQP